ncbi:MAG: indole-3-glycerol phosphate synthase TrpC [Anaerolineae bacterium]
MILQRIVETRQQVLARRCREVPESELLWRIQSDQREPVDFSHALRTPGIALIAECKRRSPSAGVIRTSPDVADICRNYAEAGAAAVSILTEPSFFGGSLDDLVTARTILAGNLTRPILLKDFVISSYQVYEARLHGADAVLLIAACLSQSELVRLMTLASSVGLTPLVEVHNRTELDIVMSLGTPVIGINNRDLTTFHVNLETTIELAPLIAGRALIVSESGITSADDVRRLAAVGVNAVLVGEALLRAPDLVAKVRELAGAVV